MFKDGDQDSCTQSDGFKLLHFRSHSIADVEKRQEICWKKVIEERIPIPADRINVYDKHEKCTGSLVYRSGSVTFEKHGHETEHGQFSPDPDVGAPGSTSNSMQCTHLPNEDPMGLSLPCEDPTRLSLPGEDPMGLSLLSENPTGLSLPGEDPMGLSLPSEDPTGLSLPSEDPTSLSLPGEDLSPSSEDPTSLPNPSLQAEVPVPSSYVTLTPSEDDTAEVRFKTGFAATVKTILEYAGEEVDQLVIFDQLRYQMKRARQQGHKNTKKQIVEYKAIVKKFFTQISDYMKRLSTDIQRPFSTTWKATQQTRPPPLL